MKITALSLSIAIALSPLASSAVELPQRPVLTAAVAEAITKAAIAECDKSETVVSVSVVNDQGRLVYFQRGDGTGANTIHTSFRKAYTSASLKISTSVLNQAPEAEGYSQLGKMEDDILLLTGGLPIFHDGALIGAIGLSGAPDPNIEEGCGEVGIKQVMDAGE
ncbi:heme-binding protein (plasmid) [Phaeobacter inhibens]|uniref:GlcG/HbpS family heme-binding protein n=1 Tax=Phaeobacter inhibens TaxID=221822 RepID=UPI0021A3F6AD|nr:heme-binding protein [Phaeobacter inhibens]UWR78652.1 heme-binding protein [Phaeobacter inhibens]